MGKIDIPLRRYKIRYSMFSIAPKQMKLVNIRKVEKRLMKQPTKDHILIEMRVVERIRTDAEYPSAFEQPKLNTHRLDVEN